MELKVTSQLPLPLARVMVQLVSAPVIATVPVGIVPDPVTVTSTATTWPGMEGSGVSFVIFVVVTGRGEVTVWLSVSKLLAWLPSPLYVAVMVSVPGVLKTALQLPAPPESVMVQLVSAPVMATVPVGVAPVPLTITPTTTVWPGMEGSGASDVMLVVVGGRGRDTIWLAVLELPVKFPSPL